MKTSPTHLAPKSLAVVFHRPADLVPDPGNPWRHPQRQLQKLKKSILTFGVTAPVLIDEKLRIIGGHARVEVARALGLELIPCLVFERLDARNRIALGMADNRIAADAVADRRKLAARFEALIELDSDFSLDLTGFDPGEIELLLTPGSKKKIVPDESSSLSQAGPVVTEPGDVWLLGYHRLACGDPTAEGILARVLDGGKAELVITDLRSTVDAPPRCRGGVASRHGATLPDRQPRTALDNLLPRLSDATVESAIHFVFADWPSTEEVLRAARAARLILVDLCIWTGAHGGSRGLYPPDHALVFVLSRGTGALPNTGRWSKRQRTNVWADTDPKTEGRLEAAEPSASKPVALIEDTLREASKRNGLVLDPVAGTGVTILAAERTGRRVAAVERSARSVDVAIRRWQAMTGKTATHDGSGLTFSAIETMKADKGAAPVGAAQQGGHHGR